MSRKTVQFDSYFESRGAVAGKVLKQDRARAAVEARVRVAERVQDDTWPNFVQLRTAQRGQALRIALDNLVRRRGLCGAGRRHRTPVVHAVANLLVALGNGEKLNQARAVPVAQLKVLDDALEPVDGDRGDLSLLSPRHDNEVSFGLFVGQHESLGKLVDFDRLEFFLLGQGRLPPRFDAGLGRDGDGRGVGGAGRWHVANVDYFRFQRTCYCQ